MTNEHKDQKHDTEKETKGNHGDAATKVHTNPEPGKKDEVTKDVKHKDADHSQSK